MERTHPEHSWLRDRYFRLRLVEPSHGQSWLKTEENDDLQCAFDFLAASPRIFFTYTIILYVIHQDWSKLTVFFFVVWDGPLGVTAVSHYA